MFAKERETPKGHLGGAAPCNQHLCWWPTNSTGLAAGAPDWADLLSSTSTCCCIIVYRFSVSVDPRKGLYSSGALQAYHWKRMIQQPPLAPLFVLGFLFFDTLVLAPFKQLILLFMYARSTTWPFTIVFDQGECRLVLCPPPHIFNQSEKISQLSRSFNEQSDSSRMPVGNLRAEISDDANSFSTQIPLWNEKGLAFFRKLWKWECEVLGPLGRQFAVFHGDWERVSDV